MCCENYNQTSVLISNCLIWNTHISFVNQMHTCTNCIFPNMIHEAPDNFVSIFPHAPFLYVVPNTDLLIHYTFYNVKIIFLSIVWDKSIPIYVLHFKHSNNTQLPRCLKNISVFIITPKQQPEDGRIAFTTNLNMMSSSCVMGCCHLDE